PTVGYRDICLATSSSPLGPFTDVAAPFMNLGRAFIDASPFYDPVSERHYLYVMEESLRPPQLVVGRLAPDLLTLDSALTPCVTATQPWESGWVEGPLVFLHAATYYMTY